MKLLNPFIITPRLLPGVQIGKAFISIELAGSNSEGRTKYLCHIDRPGKRSVTIDDLKSGCGGGSLQEGMESLLSFLGACAESYPMRHGERGENYDLFPPSIAEWAYYNSDEISMLQLEISEASEPLIQ